MMEVEDKSMYKGYKVITITGEHTFIGRHLKNRETVNWHYYETNDGAILHFRKIYMVSVEEVEASEA